MGSSGTVKDDDRKILEDEELFKANRATKQSDSSPDLPSEMARREISDLIIIRAVAVPNAVNFAAKLPPSARADRAGDEEVEIELKWKRRQN